MKDLTISAVTVMLLALAIGVMFHWVYAEVAPSAELAGLFGLVALVLRVLVARLWAAIWPRPASPLKPAEPPR